MGEDRPGSRAKGLLERARASLSRAGAHGIDGLRRTGSRVSDALGTAAERIAETEAGERLKGAFDTQRVIRRALDAQARGNARRAYELLESAHQARPDDGKLALAFWNVAASSERAHEAAPALQRVLRSRAARGEIQEAAKLWLELASAVPDAGCDAGVLIRIVPTLVEMDAEQAVKALRQALDAGAGELTPGLAARAAELARSIDPPSARRAARIALESPEIDESKRAKLQALAEGAAEREAEAAAQAQAAAQTAPEPPLTSPSSPAAAAAPGTAAAAAAPAAPGTAAAPAVPPASAAPAVRTQQVIPEAPTPEEIDAIAAEVSELVVEEDPIVEAEPHFTGIKAIEGTPLALTDDGLTIAVDGGRKATLAYERIEAIGVGEVAAADAAGIRIDLVLNWHDAVGGTLRIVRLRGEGFEPEEIANDGPAPQTLRGFLAQLLSRSNALPLPDVDAAMGDPLHVFDDEADYQREVLRVL